ncbi:MAG: response regulator [Alphaproteobacteria bacterium]|nr:response regulator [Alphaproteobacteria bacterium]
MTAPIYIVDDDAHLAESIGTVLALQGLAFRHFPSAAAFLEAADGLEVGCVLLDVHMPGMNGLAALQTLRERGIAWPVIVSTTDVDHSVEDLAWVYGAVEFLRKPYDGARLLRMLRSRLGAMNAQSES